jgi:hypothetical protein
MRKVYFSDVTSPMAFNITALAGLHILTHEHQLFISLNDLLGFLKQNHKPTDKPIKKFNIERELKNSTCKIQNDTYILVTSMIEFVCAHSSHFQICKTIVDQIQSKIVISNRNSDDHSVKELYDLIVEKPIINLNKEHYKCIEIKEDSFSSICVTYMQYDNNCEGNISLCLKENFLQMTLPIFVQINVQCVLFLFVK